MAAPFRCCSGLMLSCSKSNHDAVIPSWLRALRNAASPTTESEPALAEAVQPRSRSRKRSSRSCSSYLGCGDGSSE
jgi:hypothetical protein